MEAARFGGLEFPYVISYTFIKHLRKTLPTRRPSIFLSEKKIVFREDILTARGTREQRKIYIF